MIAYCKARKDSVCLPTFNCEINMSLSYLLATLHILTLGIGFYAIWRVPMH